MTARYSITGIYRRIRQFNTYIDYVTFYNHPSNVTVRLNMRFETSEEFKRFVIQIGRYIQDLYLRPENVDEASISAGLAQQGCAI